LSDQPKDTRLWCLHHIGADDVYPAPDFATAQKWADWANRHFADHADISRFVVAVWPHAAESHAAGLDRAISEWTVPNEPPSVNASNLQAIRDAIRAFEDALTFTPAASEEFRAGMKGGFNAADFVILGLMNARDRGSERLYEPFPGAFDFLLGREGDAP